MKVVPPLPEEIMFRQCQRLLMLNPLMMNTYYTQLFQSFAGFFQMMGDEEGHKIIQVQIKEVEGWLSDDLNKITLHEAELRMFNNLDLLSGFEVNGVLITQMQIQDRLEEIKSFLNQRLYQLMPHIRFTQPIRID